MNAAAPWWGTLVVAIAGFAGVLGSQWLSNRRDRLDRREQQRLARVGLYQDFQRVMSELTDALIRDDFARFRDLRREYMHAMMLVVTAGSPALGQAIDEVNLALSRILNSWPSTDTDRQHAMKLIGVWLGRATTLMRSEASGRSAPAVLRLYRLVRHPVKRLKMTVLRWREHWTVLEAELEQPVWPIDPGAGRSVQ